MCWSAKETFEVRPYTTFVVLVLLFYLYWYFPPETWFFSATISASYRLNDVRGLGSVYFSVILFLNILLGLMCDNFIFLFPVWTWNILRKLLHNLFQWFDMLILLLDGEVSLIQLLPEFEHFVEQFLALVG